jgi:CheY-like chemotaxis protein
MVYGFARQSGGHAVIKSAPGHGTTVELFLPRHDAPLEPAEAPAAEPIPEGPTGETVLVVEDDDDVRAYSVTALGMLGYVVHAARNAEDALGRLAELPHVDLLFSDIGLPGGTNGRQLAEAAKARCPELCVLLTTGYANRATGLDDPVAPGVSLIAKPFTLNEIALKLREVLDARCLVPPPQADADPSLSDQP